MGIKAQWTGPEDRHSKRQVCRRPGFFSAGIKGLWSNAKNLTLKWRMAASWAAHLCMALKTGKKQVCCACACVLFLSGDIPRSARFSLWRIHVLSCREGHL